MAAVLERVRLLADWVGAGKRVTARAVLRPVDVPDVARTLGIELHGHVRSAADITELHVVWTAALATGAVNVHEGLATRQPTRPFHVDDRLTALAAVFGELLGDERGVEAADVAQGMLTALHCGAPACRFDGLLLDVLYDFGAIGERCRPTEFGRIALTQLTPFDATDVVTGLCLSRITRRYVRPSWWCKVLVPATFAIDGKAIGRAFTKARRTIACGERYEITLEKALPGTEDGPRVVACSTPGDHDEVNRAPAWIQDGVVLRRSG